MSGVWRTSGLALLEILPDGRLGVTGDWLRAYLLRPELRPIEESCAAEVALHQALMADPFAPLTPVALVAVRDGDAVENYGVFAALRDLLVAHGTLEAAYIAHARAPKAALPALFLDHMVHAIMHHALGDAADPFVLRAAECLFRPQRATIADGRALLADADTLDLRKRAGHSLLELAAEAAGGATLDVLGPDNAGSYAERSDRFDLALDLAFGGPGLDGLARALEAWLRHMLEIDARLQPTGAVRDERWSWHVGLDAEASRLLDRLYAGEAPGEAELARLVALFRMAPLDPALVRPSMTGKPVYLGLAMTAGGDLRLKPQNLIVNLPVVARS
ncbi:MAG: hypothetical protein KDG89_01575 [Geminicoccaceae bacterium]|nr:hypothetical protein [Geminicoccaceae bacterium]